MIIWTKQFETGAQKLDQQHRILIENINRLEELLNVTNPTLAELKTMVDLVDYLEGYANIHFKGEEQCMEASHCPAHAENQQEHERFRGFFVIIKDCAIIKASKWNCSGTYMMS